MADRPIIFSAPMVRALLGGRKSQTRRIPKKAFAEAMDAAGDKLIRRYPHQHGSGYEVGMRLWVKETWTTYGMEALAPRERPKFYRADPDDRDGWATPPDIKWKSARFMPRWASRLTLTVTDVRVQRLQEISEEDAVAEGVRQVAGFFLADKPDGKTAGGISATAAFALLWNSLHGPDAWQANPWVCAISFTVAHRNIDAPEAPHDR